MTERPEVGSAAIASPGSGQPDDAERRLPASQDDRKVALAKAVLIVEDDYLIAMEAESALVDAGYTVSGTAATAEEAVGLARQHRPSIVVMDIRLAGRRDGIDAAGDLFREFGLRCLFASAHDDQATRTRAEPFEPLGWLSKPYTMASLVLLVGQAMRSVQAD
ncbi:response regulator [Bradyrhizobium diazoefficiens]|uniref:response regulator n=1 Tax=Bradyrhizobium diazoefficiens TaxID=1355477 RepID=UPI00272AF222|nr:response regulator [Bradyrhizobium diazoefficiens]WLA74222.1 response regulator [Bradyrhizobium diazoefficiens]